MRLRQRSKSTLRATQRWLVRSVALVAGGYGHKVFCVGRNKTGTTTMSTLLANLGYRMGPQYEAERFVNDYQHDMQQPFWDWVDAHEAFQDVPFSNSWFLPELYARYPDALYILTLRDPEEWFKSLTNHHFGALGLARDAGSKEIADALRESTYVAPGWMYRNQMKQYDITSDDLFYDRDHYIRNFEEHNALVRDTIPDRQLLEIDVTRPGVSSSLIFEFLGIPSLPFLSRSMPHMNRRR